MGGMMTNSARFTLPGSDELAQNSVIKVKCYKKGNYQQPLLILSFMESDQF